MGEVIRANSVEIVKEFRPYCRIDGCTWVGFPCLTYQEANAERQRHLAEHRERAAG